MSNPERIHAICRRCPTDACHRTLVWRRYPACRVGNGTRDKRQPPLRPTAQSHAGCRSWRNGMAQGVGTVHRGCLHTASAGGRALPRSTVMSTVAMIGGMLPLTSRGWNRRQFPQVGRDCVEWCAGRFASAMFGRGPGGCRQRGRCLRHASPCYLRRRGCVGAGDTPQPQ